MQTSIHYRVAECLSPSVRYKPWFHANLGRDIASPSDFAAAIGYAPERIAKTVILGRRGVAPAERLNAASTNFAAAVLSANKRIDMKGVANALNWTACEVASPQELNQLTSYPSRGVSPLGLPSIRLLMDEGLLTHDTVLIGAGVIGVEIEIAPTDLLDLMGASVSRLSV